MSYTFSSFCSALAAAIEDSEFSVTDTDFQALLPTIIDMAEQRLYRELDLLVANVVLISIRDDIKEHFGIANLEHLGDKV